MDKIPHTDESLPLSVRWVWLLCGHLSLLIGFIGIFLPLLPTTPLLILASFCYSKGSKRFERWLVDHPRFGPAIREWRLHGVIRLKVKLLATIGILAGISYPLFFMEIPIWGKGGMLVTVGCVLWFVLSRPSRPPIATTTERPK